LVSLMSLIIKNPPIGPKLNQKRARFVLSKIDQILDWERQTERERDTRFVELGRYLCEVRAGQYWRLENLASFDDFLQRRFPESRRKAYYLMSIHEQLPRQLRNELKQVGWSKAAELAKVARRDQEHFESANWLHKAKTTSTQQFKEEVEKHLTGTSEPSELIYFKVYKSQVPVIEQQDARIGQVARLLPGDDLRGFSGGSVCRQWRPRPVALQPPALFRFPINKPARQVHRGSSCRTTTPIADYGISQPSSSRARPLALPVLWPSPAARYPPHIIPRSRGGSYSQDNLITLCRTCHGGVHGSCQK
jgi:hypothetical protein